MGPDVHLPPFDFFDPGAIMNPRRFSVVATATAAIAAVSVVVLASPAEAGGYAQGFQGASSAGLSNAVTGRPDIPEAGYYNPAGWALQHDWGLGAGGSFLLPMVDHEDPETGARTRAEVDGSVPPFAHGYGAYRDFAAGIYLGIPYGASLQWPEDWPGRFEVTATELRVMEAAPSVAWRPIDELAIAAGPRLVWGSLGYASAIDFARPGEEGFVELDASAQGVGAQIGAWGRVHDDVSLGASWRTAITLGFEGLAEFEDVPPEMADDAHDTNAHTDLVLPHRLALGLAYDVSVMGTLSLDLEYSLWSAYDTFDVHFESDDVDDISEPRDWNNTLSMRAGIEYVAPVDGLSVRSGIAIEPSPAPADTLTPAQPDTDRTSMSLGAGYRAAEGLDVDAAYNFIILDETSSRGEGFQGVYDGLIHVFTLGVRVRPM